VPRRRRKAAWSIAVAAPLLITLAERLLGTSFPPATTLFVTLIVVVVAAMLGGAGPALAAVAVGLLAQWIFFEIPYGSLNDHRPAQAFVLVVFVLVGAGIGLLVDQLSRLTTEQAALRRIAALVARGVPSRELFSAVADEVTALLAVEGAYVAHLEADGFATILAAAGQTGDVVAGDRLQVEPWMAMATVVQTHQSARTDDVEQASPDFNARVRNAGIRSTVATPIIVERELWGVLVASSRRGLLSADSEQRMLDFTELVATAIANAESRSELVASRARIVAASDEARRRVERDLHDGLQQRLVSLALDVRAAQSGLPPSVVDVRVELSRVCEGLTAALEELREVARGIHPEVLSRRGLGPALKTLARRAPIRVVLEVDAEHDLPDGVKVAAYYAVSELLTNTVKHGQASVISVDVTGENGILHIAVRDDGVGGADWGGGSGLVGLRDRIEALGGTISLRSPIGEGTSIDVALPAGA
jgi:signal transduction histidine kinase